MSKKRYLENRDRILKEQKLKRSLMKTSQEIWKGERQRVKANQATQERLRREGN